MTILYFYRTVVKKNMNSKQPHAKQRVVALRRKINYYAMKKELFIFGLIALLTFGFSNNAAACHAMAIVNFQVTQVAGGININGSSNAQTCGCTNIYWMDIEVRCVGEPFDGAPFNPGFWGPLANYPYYQSAQMNKPGCQLVPYQTTFIPYGTMCPGINYQVRVRENHNGTIGPWSAPIPFTVPGTIDPLVGSITASQTNICQGDCVTLDANVIGGCDLAAIYTWSTGSNNPSINVCPAVTTTYTVEIFEQCSNLTTQASVTINVLPNPVPGTAAVSPGVVCIGDDVNLSLTGYDGVIQWQSAPNAGGPWTNIPGATTDNFTHGPINADMCFRAEVGGCGPSALSNVVCVTIAPLPVLTVSNETICEGETTSLTTTVSIPGGTYSWNPSGQTTANLTNVSPATTTTYEVTYNLSGCIVSESGTVTVLPQPTTLNLVDQTICSGNNATLTATPDVAGGNFLWTPGGQTTNQVTVSPPTGVHTYDVNYNVGGCEITESVVLTVNQTPTVSIDDNAICNGENTQMVAVPDFPGGTFAWTPGGETTGTINVSPGTTTTYGVTYNLNGCIATANGTLTVNPMPVAAFDFTNVCEDQLTTLTSTSNVAAPSTITDYSWDVNENGNEDYNTPNVSHDYGGFGTNQVTLTVTTESGCETSLSQTIEVYPLPIVNFTANPLCFGSPTDFTNLTTVPGGGTVNTWDWNFADGNGSAAQNPSHTYGTPGVYPVNLVAVTNNGCSGNVTNNVEIFALPVAGFNFENECFYDAIQFNNTSSPNATIFAWNFDDGSPISTQVSPTHTYNQAGTYDVTLMIYTVDGCGDTITQTVTAYPQPTAQFSVDPVCFQVNSEFNDQSSVIPVAGDVITQWFWELDNGNNSSLQNPTNTYTGEGIYNISLTVTTNNGCVHTANGTATVWPLPQVNFTPTDVCLEVATQFTDLSTISNQNTPNNNVQWAWNFGDGNTANVQNPVHTYLNDGVYNATVVVTSNNGCTNQNTLPVTVHPRPVADFTGANLAGCSPVCFDLTSLSTVNNPSSIVNYTWTFTNGATFSSPSPNLSECFENNTGNAIYLGVTLTVTSEQGCADSHFEPNYISLFHYPIAGFTWTPATPDLIFPTTTIENNSLYGNNYAWTIEGFGSSNEHSPVLNFPDVPASYPVELIVTTNEGCADTAYAIITVVDQIVFYVPNTFTPDGDQYNEVFKPIFTSGFDPYDYNLTIYNRWGEIIFESYDTNFGWDGTYGAASSTVIKDGTYVWKIEFKETMTDKRHLHTGHVTLLK
jgi:gliding motility-associated-like protein